MKKLEIRKEDLIYNLNSIKKIVNDNTKIIGVVKANGMGLGLIEYAKFLVENNIKCIAVASGECDILRIKY